VILSTHAIVGAAVASLMPDHPALAFASGVASHFAIDAIPHWDYPLRAISVKPNTGTALKLNWFLFQDLGLIMLDACVGFGPSDKAKGCRFFTPSRMPAITSRSFRKSTMAAEPITFGGALLAFRAFEAQLYSRLLFNYVARI
jgi:hypothetical protein